MNEKDIEQYLSISHLSFDNRIVSALDDMLIAAQNEGDNENANYLWYLKEAYDIQKSFVHAFELITSGKYEDAWNTFDHIDISLGFIEDNFPSSIDLNQFNLGFISRMTKEYQKLFPYHYFLSREAIIKEEKCSICGQTIKLRHHCDHIPGKVYMGRLCLREITDLDIKAFAIVTDPFDKCTILHPDGKEYNYGMLEYLLEVVQNPYTPFSVEIRKEKSEEYKHIGRNQLCPCGSGKKYKRCHLGTEGELYDHYVIVLDKKGPHKHMETKYFNTWTT